MATLKRTNTRDLPEGTPEPARPAETNLAVPDTRTPNHPSAMRALGTISAGGGLRSAPTTSQVSGPLLSEALTTFQQLGIDVPGTLLADLEHAARSFGRIAELTAEPEPFTRAHLDADDYQERWTGHVTAAAATNHARNIADAFRADLDAELNRAVKTSLPLLHRDLNAAYSSRAEQYWHPDDYALTGAERDQRAHFKHLVSTAHNWMLNLQGGSYPTDRAEWWVLFTWTPSAWRTLRNDSLPGYRSRGNAHDFAIQCGGVPELASSYTAATRACLHAEEQVR